MTGGDARSQPVPPQPVRLLVVTGGHPFPEKAFFKMLTDMHGVVWRHVRFGDGAEAALASADMETYHGLLFYDMNNQCDGYLAHLVGLSQQGKGLVFLHHAIGACADWEIYGRLVGGRARFTPDVVDGMHRVRAGFQGRVAYRARITDVAHPITTGIADFDIVDEMYHDYYVASGAQVLLRASHPASGEPLLWTHTYNQSRVVYLQQGHSDTAYSNAAFSQLLERSIHWASRVTP